MKCTDDFVRCHGPFDRSGFRSESLRRRDLVPSPLRTIKALLVERGEHSSVIESLAATITMRFAGRDIFVGTVTNHGPATQVDSTFYVEPYFVRLATPLGDQTIWCRHLERAMLEAEAGPGDSIALVHEGRLSAPTELVRDRGAPNATAEHRLMPWAALSIGEVIDAGKQQLFDAMRDLQASCCLHSRYSYLN